MQRMKYKETIEMIYYGQSNGEWNKEALAMPGLMLADRKATINKLTGCQWDQKDAEKRVSYSM